MKLRGVRLSIGIALAGIVIGCAHAAQSAPDGAANPLVGTKWQVHALGANAVLESAKPTLEFSAVDKVSGTGSCNRFNGVVTVSGKSITFGPMATTRMACADAVNRQEATYFKALTEAEWFTIHDTTLSIYTKAMDLPLVFVRSQAR